MIVTHDGSHGDSCFGCRIKTVGFSAMAMPTRKPNVSKIEATQKQWDRDDAAYIAMRKDGLQPRSTVGAADIQARATESWEVEQVPRFVHEAPELVIGGEKGLEMTKEIKAEAAA